MVFLDNKKTFYITTPIYYPSDKLHMGHAYSTVAADAFARFKRLTGYDVYFLTGADEHGQKIERVSQAHGKTPQEYVDNIVEGIQNLWNKLEISNDDFIRTTEERHKKVVAKVFEKLYDKGDIYKGKYRGWYCNPCESLWTEGRLDNGNCPDCGRPVEILEEESYFFKLSNYAERLLKYIEDNPQFILPITRRNEMISFINSGLEDLSISRTTFNWGIPVPFDPEHVIYVWIDALSNYLSSLGYETENDSLYQKFWPADVHLMAKDIVRFHSIIWPIILMALDLPLPKQILAHGWLLMDTGKMSKSMGNVIDPSLLIDKYGVDCVRYYLLRELPFNSDGYYTEESLVNRINQDLANDFGNLVSRTLGMLQKYFKGNVQKAIAKENLDQELIDLATKTPALVEELMEKREISNAIGAIWNLVYRANKYVDETSPWILAKDETKKERLGTVLYNLLESIRFITIMASAYMPKMPDKVWAMLDILDNKELHTWYSLKWGQYPSDKKLEKATPLFPRIDLATLEE